jgi:hypothetical protein
MLKRWIEEASNSVETLTEQRAVQPRSIVAATLWPSSRHAAGDAARC